MRTGENQQRSDNTRDNLRREVYTLGITLRREVYTQGYTHHGIPSLLHHPGYTSSQHPCTARAVCGGYRPPGGEEKRLWAPSWD